MNKHNIFWSIVLIGTGAILLLYALNIGTELGIIPMIATLLLAVIGIASVIRLNFVFFTLPVAGIVYIWKSQLGVDDLVLWQLLLGAFLLGIGLTAVFWRPRKKLHHHHGCHQHGEPSVVITDSENEINVSSSFGEKIEYIRSDAFEKAHLRAHFASLKIYFDQCTLSPNGATVDLDVRFAGVEIFVPRDWNVIDKAHVFAGSIEGMGPSKVDAPTITLVGDVSFSGVEIKYL